MMKIKPCPCCGENIDSDEYPYPDDRSGDVWVIVCPQKCDLVMYGDSKEHVVSKWNKRVDNSALPHYAEAVNRIDDFLEYRYKHCSVDQIKAIIMDSIDEITRKIKEDLK